MKPFIIQLEMFNIITIDEKENKQDFESKFYFNTKRIKSKRLSEKKLKIYSHHVELLKEIGGKKGIL